MKSIIATVIIFLVFFSYMIKVSASHSGDVLVITHGSGGDFSGANVLYEKLNLAGKKVKLYNLEKVNIDSIDFIKAKTLVIIGLDAINSLMNHRVTLSNYKIIFYSHLYNFDMVDFINHIDKNRLYRTAKIIVFITNSQLTSLNNLKFKMENLSRVILMRRCLASMSSLHMMKNKKCLNQL